MGSVEVHCHGKLLQMVPSRGTFLKVEKNKKPIVCSSRSTSADATTSTKEGLPHSKWDRRHSPSSWENILKINTLPMRGRDVVH